MREPDRLKKETIWSIAEEFRKQYVKPISKIPIPIEEILEFDLGLSVITLLGLMQKADIDAFLSNNLKSIYVDTDMYQNPKWERRLRFTYAHEIGHFILHKDIIKETKFADSNDWKKFRIEFPDDLLSWFEYQAYEFAGRLLVPVDILSIKLEKLRPMALDYLKKYDNTELLLEAISRKICDDFGVSDQVIKKRIKIEGLQDLILK
jgi:Zn-dependent peptidase ImmA (M78 family)